MVKIIAGWKAMPVSVRAAMTAATEIAKSMKKIQAR